MLVRAPCSVSIFVRRLSLALKGAGILDLGDGDMDGDGVAVAEDHSRCTAARDVKDL